MSVFGTGSLLVREISKWQSYMTAEKQQITTWRVPASLKIWCCKDLCLDNVGKQIWLGLQPTSSIVSLLLCQKQVQIVRRQNGRVSKDHVLLDKFMPTFVSFGWVVLSDFCTTFDLSFQNQEMFPHDLMSRYNVKLVALWNNRNPSSSLLECPGHKWQCSEFKKLA